MNFKVQPGSYNGDGDLAQELEKVFTEEWGGPKSAMAMAYLRDTVIPDLASCLVANRQLLENSTFREIIISKLNSQFAYPPVFAQGLAGDILGCAKRVLGKNSKFENHPWQPWEVIMRMLTIGYRLPDIAQKTGFPPAYLELFRKQYYKLQDLADRGVSTEEQLLAHRDLAGTDVNLIRFMVDFRNRFTIFKSYYERLQAEQIIMEAGLEMEPDTLIKLFEGLYQVEKQVDGNRFTDILKGSRTAWLTGDSYYTKTAGYGLLSDWPKKHILTMLEFLAESNLLIKEFPGESLSLSEQASRLIVPLVVPVLADEVQAVLRSKARDKISRSLALFQGKNPEITVHLVRELVRRRENAVVVCFKALQRRVPKKVFLQIIWACGQLGGKDAISLLSKTIQDKDSLVRVRSCQAMGQMADQSFYFSLIAALDDEVALVRENAAQALGKLKMITALKRLERLINNPAEEPQVQRAARETRTILLKEKELREEEQQ